MTYQLGVDLGSTFTVAAVAKDGRVETANLGECSAAMPSVVYVGPAGDVLAGDAARRRERTEPFRVARRFKRRLGDPQPVMVGGVPYAAERLLADVLRSAVEAVALREGAPAQRVVMTCPATWGAFKRDVLANAVRIAGVDASILTEAEAAAVYYASESRVESGETLAVYSLGGGRFEATVVCRTGQGFEVVGQPEEIDRADDVDDLVFRYVADRVPDVRALEPGDPSAAAALVELRDECIAGKEALSFDTEVSIPVRLPASTTDVRLTRADFEAMIRPFLLETTAALSRVVASAGLTPTGLTDVLLVGGSSQIPLVSRLVSAELGRPVTVQSRPDQVVALGAALTAAATAVPAAALEVDEDVQFSVYRPSRVRPEQWHPLLVFAHRTTPVEGADGRVTDPVAVVERQARALLEDEAVSFAALRADATAGLTRGTEIRCQPWLDVGEVNPPSAIFQWLEAVHRAEFRIRLPAAADGTTVRGGVRVFVGVMLVGEVPFRLQVSSDAPAVALPVPTPPARAYRHIFASYSHRDAALVEAVARYVNITGDRYLIDAQTLRSGEQWERHLEELIEQADVFQLFWSHNSMRSQFVRQEWEFALSLGRARFVRPVYWDDPLPEDPALGLPTEALRALHFSKLAVDAPPPPPAPAEQPAASPGAAAPQAQRPWWQPPMHGQRPSPGDLVCGECGQGNDPTRRFCSRCGSSLEGAAAARAVRRSPVAVALLVAVVLVVVLLVALLR